MYGYAHTYIIIHTHIKRERELHVQVNHRKGPHANFIHKMTDDLSSVATPFRVLSVAVQMLITLAHRSVLLIKRHGLDRLLFTSGKKPLPLQLGHGLVVKGVFVPHEKTTPQRMLKKVHHALSGATATIQTVTSPERVNRPNY